jgi:hypothetical protein
LRKSKALDRKICPSLNLWWVTTAAYIDQMIQ